MFWSCLIYADVSSQTKLASIFVSCSLNYSGFRQQVNRQYFSNIWGKSARFLGTLKLGWIPECNNILVTVITDEGIVD